MEDENTIARCISILEEIGKNINTISPEEAKEKMEEINEAGLEKTLQRKINELTNQPLSSEEAEEYIRLGRALVNASIRLTYNHEALVKLVGKTVYIRQKMAVILGSIVVNPELKKWHEEALDQLINLTRENYIFYLAPSKAQMALQEYMETYSIKEITKLIKKIEENEKTFEEEIMENNWPLHISKFMKGITFYETYEDAICLLAERDPEKFIEYSEEKFKEKKPVLCIRYFKGLERAVKNIMSLMSEEKLIPPGTTEKLGKIDRFLENNDVSGAREGIWEYIDEQLINLFTAELRAASNVADIKKILEQSPNALVTLMEKILRTVRWVKYAIYRSEIWAKVKLREINSELKWVVPSICFRLSEGTASKEEKELFVKLIKELEDTHGGDEVYAKRTAFVKQMVLGRIHEISPNEFLRNFGETIMWVKETAKLVTVGETEATKIVERVRRRIARLKGQDGTLAPATGFGRIGLNTKRGQFNLAKKGKYHGSRRRFGLKTRQ